MDVQTSLSRIPDWMSLYTTLQARTKLNSKKINKDKNNPRERSACGMMRSSDKERRQIRGTRTTLARARWEIECREARIRCEIDKRQGTTARDDPCPARQMELARPGYTGFQKGPRNAIQIQRSNHQRMEIVDGAGIVACPEQ